jgi:hypothetical protein
LASSFSWDLAHRDIFTDDNTTWYGPGKILSAVFVGNSGYGGVATVTDEVGGDGTVRVATANLNPLRIGLTYSKATQAPAVLLDDRSDQYGIPLYVSKGDDHGSIAFKGGGPNNPNTAADIVRALSTPEATWSSFCSHAKAITDGLYGNASALDDYFHAYQNVVLRVEDSMANPVEDYLIEFHQEPGDKRGLFDSLSLSGRIQRKALVDVHAYSSDSSCRSFYVNSTLLSSLIEKNKSLYIRLAASPEFKDRNDDKYAVGYQDLADIKLTPDTWKKAFGGNRTVLVDVRIPRVVGPRAFRLSKA